MLKGIFHSLINQQYLQQMINPATFQLTNITNNPFNSNINQPLNAPVPGQMVQPEWNNNNLQSNTLDQPINPLHKKQSSKHIRTLIAMLILVIGIIIAIVLSTTIEPSIGIVLAIIAACYLIYLSLACCCNRLSQYLKNIDHGQNLQHYYQWIRQTDGHFWFHAECYHYQTRTENIVRTDSNGRSYVQTRTRTQKVVTHVAKQVIIPTHTRDISGVIDRIRAATNMVFVHFLVGYKFANNASEQMFDRMYNQFRARNNMDTHQDYSFGYKVTGLVERKAFYVGQLTCQYQTWYKLCGIIGLLWPYSLWIESKTSRYKVQMTKMLMM